MPRSLRIMTIAVLVLVGLGVVAAVFQYTLIGLPYLVIFLFRIEDEAVMSGLAWAVWIGGSALLSAAAYGVMRVGVRRRQNEAGVWAGAAAYLLACLALALMRPSQETPLGMLALTQSYLASFPIALGIGLAWLTRQTRSGTTRRPSPRHPATPIDIPQGPA